MWAALIELAAQLFSLFINRKSSATIEAEAAGASKQDAADAQSQARAVEAVANAEANAPSTVSDVESRLRHGTF